jgi:hypothetical protein
MLRVFVGAALVIAGIAAFIEAHSNAPETESRCSVETHFRGCPLDRLYVVHVGLSRTAYDLLRIGGWALVIVGGALMVMGFIRYWRTQTPDRGGVG